MTINHEISSSSLRIVQRLAVSPKCYIDVDVFSGTVHAVGCAGVNIDNVYRRCAHDDILEERARYEIR